MKILLTGGSGLLGTELLKLNNNIIAPSHSELDINNKEEVLSYINKINPDIVIHAAAVLDNRVLENNPEIAINTNISGSANIAIACIKNNIRLCYLSTDYIYQGTRGNYIEEDEILPFNFYAWTKLGGECSVKGVKNHLIIRVSFGKSEFSYPVAFSDKWSSKDYVDIIAPMILEAALSPLTGVLNLGTDRKTLFNYAKLRNSEVKPIKLADTSFFTPYDTSLNLQKWFNYKSEKSLICNHTKCRVCNSEKLTKYLDLGLLPLANNLEYTSLKGKSAERFPLQIMICEQCSLSQLSVIIDPKKLFSNYVYRSSINAPYRYHCAQMAKDLKLKEFLNEDFFVIDIACFPAGSLINTQEGYKDISNVKLDDFVLSHDNKYHKVIKLYRKQYNGEFIKIKIKSLNCNFICTSEHPIFTDRGWIKACDLTIKDLVKTVNNINISTESYLNLYDLSKKYHPFDVKVLNNRIFSVSNGKKSSLPLTINIDKKLAEIIGYYIGEGDGVAGSSIRFSFHHSKEDNKIKSIQNYLNDIFGLKSEIYMSTHQGCKCIRINSRILSAIFRGICGNGAYNKKIPSFLYKKELIPHFIKALWFTDGHVTKRKKSRNSKEKKNKYVYSSVSKILILDLRNLLESLGIVTSLQQVRNDRGFSKENGKLYRLTIERNESVRLFESLLSGEELDFLPSERFCSILSIDKLLNKDEIVYNLEVEDSNSYTCDGVVVHNCNDGTLLDEFKKEIGLNVLGIDPAQNLVAICEKLGIPAIADFWSYKITNEVIEKYGQADLITATNVFAHVNSIQEFILAAKKTLKDDGVLVIECPYIDEFIQKLEYHQTYHEHLSYISVTPIDFLCKSVGMKIIDVSKHSIHGGTVRIIIGKDCCKYEVSQSVYDIMDDEALKGYTNPQFYKDWAKKVNNSIFDIKNKLINLKKKGNSISGIAASAKGNTLLNVCGINTDILDTIIDETPEKIGKFSPGTGIPIVHKRYLQENPPDYLLILAENFKDQLIEKAKEVGFKGKFIIPVPVFEII